MLNFLQIRNYAIIESLDLDFSGGFTCVTGETGAGKSILVDALGVLCGKRADTSTIRSGARKAELSAGFELPPDSPALRWLIEAEMEDGSSCLLRRMINENGRSRAWINGTAVTLAQLAELGERLVEIHGQNEHILLLRSEQQFRLLDESGDYENDLSLLGDRYHAWSALEQQQQSLLSETPLDAGDMDLMRYQIRELEGAVIPNDEFSAIEAEHRILTRGEEILEALDYSIQALEAAQHLVFQLGLAVQQDRLEADAAKGRGGQHRGGDGGAGQAHETALGSIWQAHGCSISLGLDAGARHLGSLGLM